MRSPLTSTKEKVTVLQCARARARTLHINNQLHRLRSIRSSIRKDAPPAAYQHPLTTRPYPTSHTTIDSLVQMGGNLSSSSPQPDQRIITHTHTCTAYKENEQKKIIHFRLPAFNNQPHWFVIIILIHVSSSMQPKKQINLNKHQFILFYNRGAKFTHARTHARTNKQFSNFQEK